MNLVLEIVARDGQTPDGEPRKVFGVEGGRIGRASDCDWVLPSPYISRYHATVVCIDGAFCIVSTGENGVALNDALAALPQLEHRALKDGDRLFIDEYEIAVAISGVVPVAVRMDAPGHELASVREDGSTPVRGELESASDPFRVGDPASAVPDFTATTPSLRTAFGLDPLRKSMPAVLTPERNAPLPDAAWNHSSGLADHFAPPRLGVAPVALPADWDRTNLPASPALTSPPVAPAPAAMPPVFAVAPARFTAPPSIPAAPSGAASSPGSGAASSGVSDLSAFLRGAGIDSGGLSPEMAGTLGRMLRSVVQGLIEALSTRADFRNQFRLPVTRVKMSENNPLKFAVDADDALASLLRKRADRYLGPLEAVEDGFDDIRTHHLAMVVGMRAGFESVLNRFDPKILAKEFDRRARRNSLWPMPAGMRYWRHYVDLFETLTGEADSAFQRLFGEEFAQAYERHLETARHRRDTPPSGHS
jgi:type VI secretion system FHA domain protein